MVTRAVLLGIAFFTAASASAQAVNPHEHMHDMPMDAPASDWHFMQDGVFNLFVNEQGGPRGGGEVKSTNWWMGMLSRTVGAQRLTFTGMFSLEPATMGSGGYREIFQVGETFKGRPLVDHQHPHDLFMRLSAAWRIPLTSATALTLAGGPVGEPALGPPAFMHRASAAAVLFAPLSHHTFDSTHISFGVATASIEHGKWTAEGSVFNGREPDEHRWDFDFGAMDSVSGRLLFRPTASLELQVSSGHLVEPEPLEPGNLVRTTASASWLRSSSAGFSAATIGYGVNQAHDATRQSVFVEASRQFGPNTLSSRLELVQAETDLLLLRPEDEGGVDLVSSLTLAGQRDVVRWHGIQGALGANLVFYQVPEELRATHGRRPVSFQLFLQFRPPTGGMGRMWNMRMDQ
jgi:hypothetical protein